MRNNELRKMTFQNVINDTPITQLPIIFHGFFHECCKEAERLGYVWKPSRKYLYDGYYYNKQESACLFIT